MPELIDEFAEASSEFLEGVKARVLDALFNSVDEIDAVVLGIVTKVSRAIDILIEAADTIGVEAVAKIIDYIDAIEAKAKTELRHYQDRVIEKLGEDSSDSERLAEAAKQHIGDALDRRIKQTEESVDELIRKATPAPPVIPEPTPPVTYEPPASWLDAIKAIPTALVGIADAVAIFSKLAELTDLKHSPDIEIGAAKEAILTKPEGFAWESWGALIDSLGKIGSIVGSPFGMIPIVMDSYSAGMAEVIHNVARVNFTPTRMAMMELVTSYVRGSIGEQKLLDDGSELGFRLEDIAQYVILARQFIPVDDLLKLWLRGELKEDLTIIDRLDSMTSLEVFQQNKPGTIENRLAQLGIAGTDIKNLKKLTQLIPGVNDIITMAVREAFTPEIVEKFRQYEDYPPVLTEWAEKQGLSEEWAKHYWAAHWLLPSPQQAFEMYFRTTFEPTEFSGDSLGEVDGKPYYRVISWDNLRMLLRALDIMPAWREQLLKIAETPYTRVDIRRIHKLMGRSKEWLVKAHIDIGYSVEKAEELADFVIALNFEEVKIEKQPERDLAASEIVSAYASVLIDEDSARGLLKGLGFDSYEIDFKMALADLPAIKRIKNKQIEIIRQRLLYGAIDLNGAVDDLNKLDLPPFEMDYQLLDLQQDLELAELKETAAERKAAKKEVEAAAKAAVKESAKVAEQQSTGEATTGS